MSGIYDGPSGFAPLSEWEAWLASLRELDQDDPMVAGAIRSAEREVERLRRQQDSEKP